MAATLLAVLLVALALTWEGVSGKYYGKLIADLQDTKHGVEGKVYCVGEKQVAIVGLKYDGSGAGVAFWVGKTESKPGETGTPVPFQGKTDNLQAFNGDTVVLDLPEAITGYKYIGLWSQTEKESFGHAVIPEAFPVPAAQTLENPFDGALNGITATGAILNDSRTILLQGFKFDGSPGAYFAAAPEVDSKASLLVKLTPEKELKQKQEGEDVTATLPEDKDWTEFKLFHVYDFNDDKSLGQVMIDESKAKELPPNPIPNTKVKLPSQSTANDNEPENVKAHTYFGKNLGSLTGNGVAGTVYSVKDKTIAIADFSYDGKEEGAQFWASTTDSLDKGKMVEDAQNKNKPVKACKDATIVLTLPDDLSTYKSFGIYSKKTKKIVADIKAPDGFKAAAPQPLTVPAGAGYTVTSATLENSQEMKLTNFSNIGTDEIFFAVGEEATTEVDKATKLLDESGEAKVSVGASAKDYNLKLPQGKQWTMFKQFLVASAGSPLATVDIAAAAKEVPPKVAPQYNAGVLVTAISTAAKAAATTAATTAATEEPKKGGDGGGAAGGDGKSSTAKAEEKEEKGGIGLIVILGIVGIVVCIGVGLAFFFFFAPGAEESAPGAPVAGGTVAAGDGTAGGAADVK